MFLLRFVALATTAAGYVVTTLVNDKATCYLYPESLRHDGEAVDDAPSIHQAFQTCGQNGDVIFIDGIFNIKSVMNTTNLANCDVTLQGELRFSTDIDYWLSHS